MNGDIWQVPEIRAKFPPGVRLILFVTIGITFIQFALDALGDHIATALLGLSAYGLKHGFYWQLISYMFVHGNFMHLFLNMLGLYLMGPETERAIGTRHFLILYFLCGILGGLGWVLISDTQNVPCVGASGAIFGVIGAFAAIFPNRPITLLLFFVLPITMKAWMMAVGLGLCELFFLLTSFMGASIAYAAHLAGGLAGYLYALVLFRRVGGGLFGSSFKWTQSPEPRNRESQAKLDQILDKIASQGMNSLTRAEREYLEQAGRDRRNPAR